MGHICRQLSLLLSGDKQFNPVLMSLSGALPRVMEADAAGDFPESAERGIRYEYCPSYKAGWHQHSGWRSAVWSKRPGYRWERYLADRLVALVEETQATDIVFDGVVAYDGIIGAIKRLDGVRSTWMRRGMWQPSVKSKRLKRESVFDQVIEPGDFAADFDLGPTVGRPNITHVAPISMTEVLHRVDREAARQALGLPLEGPVLLLAPGSGAVGSVDEIGRQVVEQVQRIAPEWTIAVTKQSIAQHSIGSSDSRVVVLDDVFPLARYLAAFDAAVGASGYNAAHELLCEKVPTLFIPSLNHKTDDQPARARGLECLGAALDVMSSDLAASVTKLMDPEVREALVAGCERLPQANGGLQAAELLAADSVVGAEKVVSGAKGKKPTSPLIDLRPPVSTGIPDFEVRDTMTVEDFRGSIPIEHVLSGSSAEYRAKREQAAHWLYR